MEEHNDDLQIVGGEVAPGNLAKTSRLGLFERIRDELELMREAGDVVVLVPDLETLIRENRTLTEPPKNTAFRRLWEFWKRKVSNERQTDSR